MSDDLMTPDEVCAYLKINKDWLYDQVQAGRIPHIRLGRQLRFRRTELDAYLETHLAGERPGEPSPWPDRGSNP
jgi:excisionase family DNA binding protein